ncbi:hypothetical protein YB2330_002531 [Saitoella coloradoensis]
MARPTRINLHTPTRRNLRNTAGVGIAIAVLAILMGLLVRVSEPLVPVPAAAAVRVANAAHNVQAGMLKPDRVAQVVPGSVVEKVGTALKPHTVPQRVAVPPVAHAAAVGGAGLAGGVGVAHSVPAAVPVPAAPVMQPVFAEPIHNVAEPLPQSNQPALPIAKTDQPDARAPSLALFSLPKLKTVGKWIIWPFGVLVNVLHVVFRPVTVMVQLVWAALMAPVRLLGGFAGMLYPVYIFLGCAAIIGLIIGAFAAVGDALLWTALNHILRTVSIVAKNVLETWGWSWEEESGRPSTPTEFPAGYVTPPRPFPRSSASWSGVAGGGGQGATSPVQTIHEEEEEDEEDVWSSPASPAIEVNRFGMRTRRGSGRWRKWEDEDEDEVDGESGGYESEERTQKSNKDQSQSYWRSVEAISDRGRQRMGIRTVQVHHA